MEHKLNLSTNLLIHVKISFFYSGAFEECGERLISFVIQAHVKNAEKYLKTSPLKLKFTPDWDPAGDEFSRAATAYKVVMVVMVMVVVLIMNTVMVIGLTAIRKHCQRHNGPRVLSP